MHILFLRGIAATIIVGISITNSPITIAATPVPFPDMEQSWFVYREAVNYLRERGAINGYPDGTFKPNDPINRAEFLKIVFRGRSSNDPVGTDCYADVPADAWFAPFVCAATRRGIVNGYPDGTFKPEQTINVAEAMKMLLLAYDREITERSGERWYLPYVEDFDKTEVYPQNTFLPWQELSRERASDLLAKMLRHEEERIIPTLSAGCGKTDAGFSTTLPVNGMDRSFLFTKPSGYKSHDPYPLIIAFHGRTNSNEQVRSYYRLDREATDYIIAYPAGIPTGNGSFTWTDPGDKISTLRDVAFFDAMVEEISSHYCVDMNNIYVVGHSLGAWFANSVACARGDVVRGSATVGGSSMIAPCKGPSTAMIINNPKDSLSPHSGAIATRDLRLETNVCFDDSIPTEPSSLSCEIHQGCTGGNKVVFCPHTIDEDNRGVYYPHHWPRETGKRIVEFFNSL